MKKNIFIAAILAIFFLCFLGYSRYSSDHHEGNKHEASGQHEHGHHDDQDELTIARTIWTDKIELFVEFPVLIVGEKAVFLAHYTYLADFQPVREGQLEVELVGNETVRTVMDKPARTGIFLPEITPKKSGVYDLIFRLTTTRGSDIQSIQKLNVYSSQEEAKKNHPVEEEMHGISFLKEQQWQIDFSTVQAPNGRLASTIQVLGQVKPYWNHRSTILAPFSGRLEPPADKNSLPRLGQEVKKGESLGNLIPSVGLETKIQMQSARDQINANRLQMAVSKLELENAQRSLAIGRREAKLHLEQAKLQLVQAQRELDRIERLRQKNGATENELQEAELKVNLTKELLQSASDQLQLYPQNSMEVKSFVEQAESEQFSIPKTFSLFSPIQGTVIEVFASTHEYVAGQASLFTIVDLSKVLLEGYVYEHDIEAVKASQGVFVSIPGQNQPKIYIKGQPEWIGMMVDKEKRTIPILYASENAGRQFRIHGNIELAIETQASNSGVIIPKEALVEEAGIKMVFVQLEGELFASRLVQVKLTSGGNVLIESGISQGERVVTKGSYIIWLSTKSNKLTSTHGHPH
ncbi:MAG: efflux RND transporter periplasmic adaptor subunit [Candidatus Brocadiae bacterium]|nr:efflux RND transporter periplasmic adaptor subunit [Candidatus Brocadiia bacterium]